MPELPAPTSNPSYLAARDTFARLCLEEGRGTPAIYRPRGQGDGTLVTVLFGEIGLTPARSPVGASKGQPIGTKQLRRLSVCATAPDESETVSGSGVYQLTDPEIAAIVNLEGGDTLEVRGVLIGIPDREYVELRVPLGGPSRAGYTWSTEVQA